MGVWISIGIFALVYSVFAIYGFARDLYKFNLIIGISGTVCLAVALIILLFVPTQSIKNQYDLERFKRNKAYFESHIPSSVIENAVWTKKKIENNEWLFDVQYSLERWGIFSLAPEEVSELTPIQ